MALYTQESLTLFCNEMQASMTKLSDQMLIINTKVESISKVEDRMNNLEVKLETNKLIVQEKIEHLIYKLSVIDDKINVNTQKVNELNNVLMKHFAYKMYKPPTTQHNNNHHPAPHSNPMQSAFMTTQPISTTANQFMQQQQPGSTTTTNPPFSFMGAGGSGTNNKS